ncbi:MAG: hypothetical protein ACFFFG_18820 [Candidatus Thorarchaeota archaeon]
MAASIYDILVTNRKEEAETKTAAFLAEIDGIDEVLEIHNAHTKLLMSMYENYRTNEPDTQSIAAQPPPVTTTIPIRIHRSKRGEYLKSIGLIISLWLLANALLCYAILNSSFIIFLNLIITEAASMFTLFGLIIAIFKEERILVKEFILILLGR